MRHHLVVAHPNNKSLSHQIAHEIAGVVIRSNDLMDLFDLYDSPLPHLSKHELADYSNIANHSLNAKFVKSLRECQSLIYIYPVWMYNIPSILKAYFDWTWCPQSTFSFSHDGPLSLLSHVTKMTIVATHGMKQSEVQMSGDASMSFFCDGIGSLLSSRKIITRFDIYGLDKPDQTQIAVEISKIKNHFRSLGGGHVQ